MQRISNQDARKLIELVKEAIAHHINFPSQGVKKEFDVKAKESKDLFSITIQRGKINNKKVNYNARIKVNGLVLMELHVNPGSVHINPDGEEINGTHWHIYDEEYYLKKAILVPDPTDESFTDITLKFLNEFNVIQPLILYQTEIL